MYSNYYSKGNDIGRIKINLIKITSFFKNVCNFGTLKKYKIMKLFSLLLFTLFVWNIQSQDIVSVEKLGERSRAEVQREFLTVSITYGTIYYKVRYTSVDAKGEKDTLSGLLVIPNQKNNIYPMLVYQHGTSSCKTCVPSRLGSAGGDEGELGCLFAGLGYVSCLPDYVGMGDGRGFQTYVHASTLASATHDMVLAVKQWMETQSDIEINDQLFITGYSQGGYASMAYQKFLEENVSTSAVTASAHLSGPFSLSGVMRDLILSDAPYLYVAYLPNTVMGFNEYYNVFEKTSDFFKPEYVEDINRYISGEFNIVQLNVSLLIKLNIFSGRQVTKNMIRNDVLEEIVNNPDHPLNRILRENDLFNWKPETPTAIFYCRADDQVPFMNSVVARDTMMALGVQNLLVRDVLSTGNHGECVQPALTATIQYFRQYQNIRTNTQDVAFSNLRIFPNPTSQIIHIESASNEIKRLDIKDIYGKSLVHLDNLNTYNLSQDVSSFTSGLYFVNITYNNQTTETKKIIVQ